MRNELKYGLLIGILSGIWLLIMHFTGVYADDNSINGRTSWMEYASVVIPVIGLFLGIKSFRDNRNGGKMEVFEGLMAGFLILMVAGIIVAFFAVVYIQMVPSALQTGYMGRIAAAGIVGILLNIVISLILMNKQRNL